MNTRSLTLLIAFLPVLSVVAEGTGSIRTFQSSLRFEESAPGYLRTITVKSGPRLTSFHPEKKEASIGVAWQEIQLQDRARALVFDLYGGSGEVLLLGEGNELIPGSVSGVPKLAEEIRSGLHGRIIHRATGPFSVEQSVEVRWDLRPVRNERIKLVILDDQSGDWGFIEAGPIHLISDLVTGEPVSADSRAAAGAPALTTNGAPDTIMPGGSDWGYLGGPFFKRKLLRGRLPFLTTYLPDLKTRSTGATWRPIQLVEESADLTFQIRGGRGRVILLRGWHDFSGHPNVGSLAREVDFDLADLVLHEARGGERAENFQEITWTMDRTDGRWLTLLVLDELEGEWGYLDVSHFRVVTN